MHQHFIPLTRIVKAGTNNFRRNLWLAGASTLIMVVTLVILSVLSLLFIITNYSVKTIQERVDISAYFQTGVAESRIQEVIANLEKDDRVKEINYVSAEEALRKFKEKNSKETLIIESLNELNENPLPATLQIKAKEMGDYPAIAELLQTDDFKPVFEKVNFEDNRLIIERLNKLLNFIITFGVTLTVVFFIIAVLVIFNTIALTIYNRREEVEIMRLVGATNWYIRGPFITESLIYSVLATIITGIMLIPVYFSLLPGVSSYLTPGTAMFTGGVGLYLLIILALLAVAVILSTISSLLAMRKYLKV